MVYLPFLQLVTLPGLDTCLLKESFQRKKISLGVIYIYKVLISLVFCLCTFLALYFYGVSSETYYFMALPFIFLIPFFETSYFVKNRYLGYGRAKIANILVAKFSILRFSIVLAIILFNSFFELHIVLISIAFIFANSLYPIYFFFKRGYYRVQFSQVLDKQNIQHLKNGVVFTLIGAFFTLIYSFDRLFISSVMDEKYFAYYSVLVMLPIEFARTIDFTLPSFYSYILKFKFLNKKFFASLIPISIVLGTLYYLLVELLYPLIFGEFYTYDYKLILISMIYSIGLVFDFTCIHFITNLIGKRSLMYFNLVNLIYYSVVAFFLYNNFDLLLFISLIFIKQLFIFIFVISRCKLIYERRIAYS